MKISKKLLLTTVLSSAMVAGNAQAADYALTYNGGVADVYTLNLPTPSSYDTLLDVYNFVTDTANAVDLNANNIVMDNANIEVFLTALAATDSLLVDQLTELFAKEAGVTTDDAKAAIKTSLTDDITVLSALITDGSLTIDSLAGVVDFSKLFSDDDFAKLQDSFKYLKEEAVLTIAEDAADDKIDEIVAAADEDFQTAYTERNTILGIAVGERTTEQKTKLLELTSEVYANTDVAGFRKSKEKQEVLKEKLNRIKLAKASSNTKLNTKATEELALLKNNLDDYLITKVTAANIKDLPSVQASDSAASESLVNASLAIGSTVSQRISNVAGMASGDPFETYGVWVKGIFTQGTQKAHGLESGYKFDQKGVTIGADTGDEAMIGIAYSFFQNDVKNKTNSGTKDDIQSHTGTLYGSYAITDEAFVSGQAQYGKATVKKTRKSLIGTSKAKPDATTMAAKLEVGYNYDIGNDVYIVPTVGVSYVDVKVDAYTETGTAINRPVPKRTSNRTSGTAGVMAKYMYDMGSMKIVPEIHANIDYAFNTKNSNTTVKLGDLDAIATPSQNLEKGYYNVGTSVKAISSDMYEISAGYDLGISKKFQSHTGTLKLRVNL